MPEMGAMFVPDPTEEARENVVAGRLCCRCGKYSAFGPDDERICKHCNHDENGRVRAALGGVAFQHVPGTKYMSPGVAKKLHQNKKYYESRADDIRSGALVLDIPRGAPDAPDIPKKIY